MTDGFTAIVDLTAIDDDTFIGPPPPDQGARTYGGQVLAQTLAAAQRTVPDDRRAHSLHSCLLRAGRATEPLVVTVDRVRDGRSFSQRNVVALQNDREVMRSLVSFHVPEKGLEWDPPVTIDVAPPTSEQPYTDYGDVVDAVLPATERPWLGRLRPMDVRHVNPPLLVDGRPVTEPQEMWMRVDGGAVGDRRSGEPPVSDQAIHDAGLVYLADLGMNPAILLPHGYSWRDERVTEATLDHAMWFHRPARTTSGSSVGNGWR